MDTVRWDMLGPVAGLLAIVGACVFLLWLFGAIERAERKRGIVPWYDRLWPPRK
jgi:hypothetical protein